jgi:hypothetical protein
MARTARRWMLPSALLVILLKSFNENVGTSFLSGAVRSPLWRCPECSWVERWSNGKPPRCRGPDGDQHPVAVRTVRLDGEDYPPNGGPKRFFR